MTHNLQRTASIALPILGLLCIGAYLWPNHDEPAARVRPPRVLTDPTPTPSTPKPYKHAIYVPPSGPTILKNSPHAPGRSPIPARGTGGHKPVKGKKITTAC